MDACQTRHQESVDALATRLSRKSFSVIAKNLMYYSGGVQAGEIDVYRERRAGAVTYITAFEVKTGLNRPEREAQRQARNFYRTFSDDEYTRYDFVYVHASGLARRILR